MTDKEQHKFEVELIVRGAGQPDAQVSREYQSFDAASTDKALKEIHDSIDVATLARMNGVNDKD